MSNFRYEIASDREDGIEKPPELKLLSHLLLRAILDLFSGKHNRQREASKWIGSNSPKDWSYLWVTLHLDLNPFVLRKLLKNLPEEQKKIIGDKRIKDGFYTHTSALSKMIGFKSRYSQYLERKKAKNLS